MGPLRLSGLELLATALSVATHSRGVGVLLPLHLPGGPRWPLSEPNLSHFA